MRFNPWTELGTYTFTPNDDVVVIGSFSLAPGDDSIWVDIKCTNTGPWPWSYGLLGFKTSFGYELGETKAFGKSDGEVYRIGNGLQPLERAGVITFSPRSFNLQWIKHGYPWTLTFKAQSGKNSSGGGGSDVDSGTLSSFADSRTDAPLKLFRIDFR